SYTITVKAKGSNCSSGNSAPVQVQAVYHGHLGAGGQFTQHIAGTAMGLSTTLPVSGSQCNVTGLRCGQLYHVNVTASDGLCSSPPSATVNTNSGTEKRIHAYTCLYTLYTSHSSSHRDFLLN
ncbi:hypothetical protein cypCar_00024340, partial [Cyprinus carpio]